MMIRQPYSNELYHHGIKGQNWGIRRYQNYDGSLTEAGKRRYGIFGRFKAKKKLSKDAKMRAKDRTKMKNDEVRRAALEAETARLNAQRQAEEAETQLREAKKQNSLIYRTAKYVSEKEQQARNERESQKSKPEKLSKNEKKLAAAIEAGNDRRVSKILKNLDNEEYSKAVNRINMKYSMDLAKKTHSTEKMKQTVEKLNQIASGAGNVVTIYNTVAGIASAFSGNDIPKINTKVSDPLTNLEQMYKNDKAKADADKARHQAEQEKLKLKKQKDELSGSTTDNLGQENLKPGLKPNPKPNIDKPKKNSLERFLTPGSDKDWDGFNKILDNVYTPNGTIDISSLPEDQQDLFWKLINEG